MFKHIQNFTDQIGPRYIIPIAPLIRWFATIMNHLYKGTMFLNWITYLTRLVFILCLSDSIVQWPPTRRYSPPRRLTSKELFTLFVLILGHFWCSVVTSVTLSSNISNFERKQKIRKNLKKLNFKNLKKCNKKSINCQKHRKNLKINF